MIYLLAQIGLSLALALIAGWYIGWTWRGFRDQDSVEDARRTLHATQEVKDRDLIESYRRSDSLQVEVDAARRRIGELERELSAAGEASPAVGRRSPKIQPVRAGNLVRLESVDASFPAEERRARPLRPEPESTPATPPRPATAARSDPEPGPDLASRLADREAALTAARAEAASLRASVEARAAEAAGLEAQVIELESSAVRLQEYEGRVSALRDELRRAEEALADHSRASAEATAHRERLDQEIARRDAALNEVRNRHNDAIASLQERHGAETTRLRDELARLELRLAEPNAELQRVQRAAERDQQRARDEIARCSSMLQRLEGQLEEAERKLQRQIERNRKLETVHRHEVAELRRLAESGAQGDA